jgi:fatty-acyl-CoA synthase
MSSAAASADVDIDQLVARARQNGLGDLLRRTAARYPDKLAVVAEDLSQSYAQLNASVNRLASGLSVAGLSAGDRLAVLSHNCWEYGALTFAAAKLGVVLVPINFMLSAEEVGFILEHSGAQHLVVEDVLALVGEQALAHAGAKSGVRGWIGLSGLQPAPGWTRVRDWAEGGSDAEPEVVVADDDPVQFMYTSGTESRPKGAMLSSRSLIAQYVSCVVDGGMTSDDVELHALPMYHCAQLHCFFVPDVYLGATSIILPGPSPAAVLAAIEQYRVTKFFAPPTVWISLLRSPDFDRTDLSSLRKGYYGASAMPVEVLLEIQRRLPELRLWNFYGQTELAPVATILQPDEQASRAGSAGRPVLNVETVLLDDDDNPVPPGTVGEIAHRSPQIVLGYWNDPVKTRESFRNGWFHSGDLGVMTEDGYLSVVDRKKDMIKSGGENVASREVEEAIYLLDGIAEVAVFGISHPHWIEAVVAAVVPKQGQALSAEDVERHCREHLAGYKRPKYVVLVGALPKNPSGKLLKRELRLQFADLSAS